MLLTYLPHILLLAGIVAYKTGLLDRLFNSVTPVAQPGQPEKPLAILESELHDLLSKYLESKSKQSSVLDLLDQFLQSRKQASPPKM